MKRKAAAVALTSSKNGRRFEHTGDAVKMSKQQKGEWKEEAWVINGETNYGEEKAGYKPWNKRFWDEEGRLVDEGKNHEGHMVTSFGLVDANTMVMKVGLLVDPPSGNVWTRTYSRDGEQLSA